MTTLTRRHVLRTGLAALVAWAGGAGTLLSATLARAAEWPKAAFGSKMLDESIRALFGHSTVALSSAVKITAQYQAENGATVPFAVSTDLPGVSTIAVFVEKNERPLVTAINFSGALPYLSLRLKMGQTSDVHVVVNSQGKLYGTKQTIRITVGGCGG